MSGNRPTTLLAELTYRCPLHCPYCSNPLAMTGAEGELTTEQWKRDGDAKRPRGLKIDDQFHFRGLMDWQVVWLLALENPAG